MADSRYAARRLYKDRWSLSVKATQFLSVVGLAFLLTYWISDETYSDTAYYTLMLLFISVGLWITEAIPPFAVAILIMGYLIFALGSAYFNSEPIDPTKYTSTLSSSIIWLLLGGFFLSQGMQKTRLDLAVFRFAASIFGSHPNKMLLGLMLTTLFSSMILSNTAATAMMIASVLPFIRTLEKNAPIAKAILIGIPTAATIGGMGTIIGSPPNAVAVALLQERGTDLSFVGWMIIGIVPAIFLCLSFWVILIKVFRSKRESLDLKIESGTQEKVNLRDQRRVIFVLVTTVILWFTTPIHHIPVAAVAFIPIVILPIFGIITARDFNNMPWDTLILVAGGLSLGMALEDAGLITRFVNNLDISSISPFLVMLAFGWICMALSNVMSNTAASTVLLPVAISILPSHSLEIAVVVALSASCALLLPVSTPPNAIAFGTGFLKQKDFRLGGIVLGLLGPLVAVSWVYILSQMLDLTI
jgi:sodium-dependent dicarboxylate transporter 2/3/5